MAAALAEARLALEAGEFPVGCVLVADNRIIARGHRINSRDEAANEIDHAEIIAMREYLGSSKDTSADQITVYSTMEPCLMCYATLLLNGVRRFVYAYEDSMGGGTGLDLGNLPQLYKEMRVKITDGICREESLALFREFFSAPENRYWQGSLLAEYTLRQS